MNAFHLSAWDIFAWTVIVALFLLVYTFMIPLLQEMGLWGKRDRTKEIEQAKFLARLISGAELLLLEASVPGMAVLVFRTNIPEIEEGRLVFSSKHPDFQAIAKLARFDRIRFRMEDNPAKKVR